MDIVSEINKITLRCKLYVEVELKLKKMKKMKQRDYYHTSTGFWV